METLHNTATEAPAPETSLEPIVQDLPENIGLSRGQRVAGKAKRIVKGEALGTALDAGLMAAGIPLPARELAGVALDVKTYGSHDHEHEDAHEKARLRKLGHAAGFFALNLAAGYALQRGIPLASHLAGENIHNGIVEGGFQLGGKISVMASATPFINRRFGV